MDSNSDGAIDFENMKFAEHKMHASHDLKQRTMKKLMNLINQHKIDMEAATTQNNRSALELNHNIRVAKLK